MNIMQLMPQMQTKFVPNLRNKQINTVEQGDRFLTLLSENQQINVDSETLDVELPLQLMESLRQDEDTDIALQIQEDLLPAMNGADVTILKDLLLSFVHLIEVEGKQLSEGIETQATEDVQLDALSLSNDELSIIANMIQMFVNKDAVEHPQQNGELLFLLKQFSRLSEETQEEIYRKLETKVEDKPLKTFQLLVKAMENRTEMTIQQMYQTDAEVTKADVSKWLEQAFQRYENSPNTQIVYAAPVQSGTTVQMDAIQQYDVHIRNTGKVEEVSQQMITKLTNIIQKSHFVQQNGLTQLQVTLNPIQLGEITVRMQEVNGEIMVKLLVTSSATKKILESNIHQLKHLFSPHQITIEKDPEISDEEFFHDEEKEQTEEEEMHEEQPEREDVQSDIDFAQLLQELGKEEQNDDEN